MGNIINIMNKTIFFFFKVLPVHLSIPVGYKIIFEFWNINLQIRWIIREHNSIYTLIALTKKKIIIIIIQIAWIDCYKCINNTKATRERAYFKFYEIKSKINLKLYLKKVICAKISTQNRVYEANHQVNILGNKYRSISG